MYFQPKNLDEALEIKAKLGADGTLLAGGTDLVVGIRKGRTQVSNFIDLSKVAELGELQEQDGFLRIGAATVHRRLESCAHKALADAAATVGGPQIRNLGTVGGQIGTASPAGDVSVALIALNAEVELLSAARGSRRLPLADIFTGPGKTSIADDELIRAVWVPHGRRSEFYKIGKRDAVAISVVMAAASIGPSNDVAIGIGCVAPTPLRCRRAEDHINSHGLDGATINDAAQIVREDVSPIDDHRAGAAYRREMAGTLTKRLLWRLLHSKGG